MHTCVCLLVQWRSIPHPRSFAAGDSKNWTEFPVLSGCTQVGRGVWTRTEMNQPGWLRTHGQHVLVSPWGGGGHSPRNRSGHPEEIRLCSRVHPPPPVGQSRVIFAATMTPVQISRKCPQLGKWCLLITDKMKKNIRVSFGLVITEHLGTYFGGGIDSLSEWLL